jgi:N-acyl homoserine lactone hydrolase
MVADSQPPAASLPLAEGSPEATVRLHPILCGESLATPGWFYGEKGRGATRRALGIGVPKSERLRSPIGAFLLEHPTAGRILVDTGLHPSAADRLKANFGRLNAFVFSTLRTSPERSVAAWLRERGIDPGELALVLMTHLHVDHASAMSEFPEATFVCARAEWQAATARFGAWWGYAHHQLPPPSRVRTIDFDRDCRQPHPPFRRAVDALADGSVRLLYTPGHTSGHTSVLVRLAERHALLVGDAVYTLRNLREGILPWRMVNEEAYRRSLGELRAYAEQNVEALIIPTHDIGVWEGLQHVYH